MEVRIPDSANEGAQEYMIYGVTEKDMTDNKPLFYYSQEELFRFADKKGYFMYQVHPFRDGIKCGDPRFLHGAEKFNGHFHHYNHNDLAEEFCRKNDLIGMSGTDYHHERQPITSGIYIPETIDTNEQLVEYIFKNDFETICNAALYEQEVKKYKESMKK